MATHNGFNERHPPTALGGNATSCAAKPSSAGRVTCDGHPQRSTAVPEKEYLTRREIYSATTIYRGLGTLLRKGGHDVCDRAIRVTA